MCETGTSNGGFIFGKSEIAEGDFGESEHTDVDKVQTKTAAVSLIHCRQVTQQCKIPELLMEIWYLDVRFRERLKSSALLDKSLQLRCPPRQRPVANKVGIFNLDHRRHVRGRCAKTEMVLG